MNVLVWNCPWESQGQMFFFQGCLEDTLLSQANILTKFNEVYLAYNDFLDSEYISSNLNSEVKKIIIDTKLLYSYTGNIDVVEKLYKEDIDIINKAKNHFSSILPDNIDIILTWESPVNFLELLYPNALIISQMPGSFSRAPYPNMITFDPVGLYKNSILTRYHKEILLGNYSNSEINLAGKFANLAKNALYEVQPFEKSNFDVKGSLVLLPLQVSDHYAFQTDTGYRSQLNLLQEGLDNSCIDTETLLVTQYKSSFTEDRPITEKNIHNYKKVWPNLLWEVKFDNLPFPSQLMLPMVDEVRACTSSLIFQGMLFEKKITIVGTSYYHSYETFSESDILRNKNVVTFLLNRYQVLASSIKSDGDFLNDLLKEIYSRKQRGKKGYELCPVFSDLKAGYQDLLLSEINNFNLLKPISKVSDSVKNNYNFLNKFNTLALAKNNQYISFDIFDTLLERPLEHPSTIFQLVAQQVYVEYKLELNDFEKNRVWAESHARKTSDYEEVTLDEIYLILQDLYSLSDEEASIVKLTEISVEYELILPRKLGKKLWQLALNTGKPIVLISDMYLDAQTIMQMLSKCGYEEYSKFYLSSKIRLTKHSGALFQYVLDDLSLMGQELLHIGDNPRTDIKSATAYKIKTFFIPKSVDRLHTNAMWDKLFPQKVKEDLNKDVLLGLIANEMFSYLPITNESKSLFSGEVHRLGYSGLGPLFTGFAQWLIKECHSKNIQKLYFLAREGYILKEIFDVVARNSMISTEYLYCSRRAVNVASLQNKKDVMALAALPFASGSSLSTILLNRFGIELETLSISSRALELMTEVDIRSLNANLDGRMWLRRFCGEIYLDILEHVKLERNAYLEYLSSTGFMTNERNIGIVDIGWKGNMQASLAKLRNEKIHGFYMATLSGSELNSLVGGDMNVYIAKNQGNWGENALVKHRKIFELLTCHSDRSLKCMKYTYGGISPEFIEEQGYSTRSDIIKKLHYSAKKFSEDYCQLFSKYKMVNISSELSQKILASYLNSPNKLDVCIISGLTFEDNFSGANEVSLIDNLRSIWPEALAVESNKVSINHKKEGKKVIVKAVKNVDIPLNNVKEIKGVLKIEYLLMKKFLNDRKFKKYARSRQDFWLDSHSKLAKLWLKISE